MKIAFASDHRGYALKSALTEYAREQGHEPIDYGTDGTGSCDYVDFGRAAALLRSATQIAGCHLRRCD